MTDRHSRVRRIALGCLTVVGVVMVASLVGLVILYRLWATPPEHWVQHQQWLASTTPDERKALAVEFEKRLLGAVSYTGGAAQAAAADARADDGLGVRQVKVTQQELSAWLEHRLPDVLANQEMKLPDGLEPPMLAMRDGRLILAIRYQSPNLDQVFSMAVHPSLVSAGSDAPPQFRLRLDEVRGGRLRLPKSVMLGALDSPDVPRSVQSMVASLQGRAFDPVLPVPADRTRQARLMGLQFEPDGLNLTVNIERRHR